MDDCCDTCDDLWRTYALASTERVQLLKRQESAAGTGDVDTLRDLQLNIEIAEGTRRRAHHAIRRHLAQEHGEFQPPHPTA